MNQLTFNKICVVVGTVNNVEETKTFHPGQVYEATLVIDQGDNLFVTFADGFSSNQVPKDSVTISE